MDSKKAIRFTASCFAILVVCSIMIWGFQSDWGKVSIKRLTLAGPNGSSISTLMYVPKSATDKEQAPCVLIFHGRSNHAHANDTWSMELARRGYVVLSPDLQGGGESSPTVNRAEQAVQLTEYANTLSFVQKDSINLVGYSFGTDTCLRVYESVPDKINSIVEVFGPYRLKNYGGVDNINTNLGLLKASCDQYDYYFIGGEEACADVVTDLFDLNETVIPGKDYTWKGNLFRYMICNHTLHQTGNISGTTLDNLISYITSVSKAPINLGLNNQTWVYQQIFSGIACVAIMFFLASLINLLMQNSFFKTASNPVPVKEARSGGRNWAVDLLFCLMIPAVLFIPVSAYCMRYTAPGTFISKVLTSTNLNGIMGWLLLTAAIGGARMFLTAKKRIKAGESITLSDYALGGKSENHIDWNKPLKGLLIGIICAAVIFIWINTMEGVFGINYQVWNLSTYLRISPMRFVRSIPYIVIIFVVMFIGNMNQRILPSTGNEKKDMLIAVSVNTVLTASALLVLLIIQYGGNLIIATGQTILPQIDIYNNGGVPSAGALDFSFGYCYMMGGTTGVVTYIYRKYGNIWLGVIPASIFAGLVTLSGFTLVA